MTTGLGGAHGDPAREANPAARNGAHQPDASSRDARLMKVPSWLLPPRPEFQGQLRAAKIRECAWREKLTRRPEIFSISRDSKWPDLGRGREFRAQRTAIPHIQ